MPSSQRCWCGGFAASRKAQSREAGVRAQERAGQHDKAHQGSLDSRGLANFPEREPRPQLTWPAIFFSCQTGSRFPSVSLTIHIHAWVYPFMHHLVHVCGMSTLSTHLGAWDTALNETSKNLYLFELLFYGEETGGKYNQLARHVLA